MSDTLIEQIGDGTMTPQQAFTLIVLRTFSPEAVSLPERYEIDPHYEQQLTAASKEYARLRALSQAEWEEMAHRQHETIMRDASDLHSAWSTRLERLETTLTHIRAIQVGRALEEFKQRIVELLVRGITEHQLAMSQSSVAGKVSTTDEFKDLTLRHAKELLHRRQDAYDYHCKDVRYKNDVLAALRLQRFS